VIEFEQEHRPFKTIQEHDDELIYRWNNTVKKHDTVWHLGDVLFGEKSFETLRRLNGIKKLVMGNHDKYPTQKYLEHFNAVYGLVKLRDCVLSHCPVHPAQLYRFKGNLHGHLHSKSVDDPRYVNVSCEQQGLAPMLLDTVILRLEQQIAGVV
jgi:calcineurin-like phosphoesterase family protein